MAAQIAYAGKYIDRSPSLRAAGALTYKKEEDIANCFVHEVTEDEARPFVCKTGPLEYKLPPQRTNIYKGWYSDVRACVQPELEQKSFFDVLTKEFKETSYDSYWKKPLGRVADQIPMLPAGMDPQKVCFGRPTPKEISAGLLISPPKSYTEVMAESRVGHEMYKQTHNDYDPGEQIRRNYIQPYHETLIWGKSTPCDPQGGCMRKVMADDRDDKLLVSKIIAEHRKRTKPQLGKVFAPNNNIERVPEDHAFGRLNKRDMYGVGELMKDSPPNLDKLDLFEELCHINVLRQQISKKPSFPHRDFIDEFHQNDLQNTGCLALDKVYEILAKFQIQPDKLLFENLLTRLNNLTKDRRVAYEEIANMLNVNSVFPDIKRLDDVPNEFLNFETTNQFAHKYHCSDDFDARNIRPAGIPPKDHIPIESLVSPTIFTDYGLEPKDFFVSKSPEYLRTLFARMGCELDDPTFEKIWNAASDRNGCVSVNSFYKALKLCK